MTEVDLDDQLKPIRPASGLANYYTLSNQPNDCSSIGSKVQASETILQDLGTDNLATWHGDHLSEGETNSFPILPAPSEHPVFGVALNSTIATGAGKRRYSFDNASSSTPVPTKKLKTDLKLADLGKSPDWREVDEQEASDGPLFFSNTPRLRPQLPRFSSSDASAAMMKKAMVEETPAPGLLQRMNLTRSSVPTTSPKSRFHARNNSSKTQAVEEAEILAKSITALSQVGVLELLEQDDRLLFIIDLSDRRNFAPGPLNIIFANTTLKGLNSVHNAIRARFSDDSRAIITGIGFPEFKAWAISFVEDDQAMDVTLPAYAFGGVLWTCSHLRKQFRVFYGSLITSSGKVPAISYRQQVLSTISLNSKRGTSLPEGMEVHQAESSDYFGTALTSSANPVGTPEALVRSVESPGIDSKQPSNHSDSSEKWILPVPSTEPREEDVASVRPTLSLKDLGQHGSDREIQYPLGPMTAEYGFIDWTRLHVTPALPKHIQFSRSINWAGTSLGPIESWSNVLRSVSNLLMASPHPTAMYWGQDDVAIYNEPYILLAGQKHPKLMGQTYREAWGEIWSFVKDSFLLAKETGQSVMKDDDLLFLNRHGFLEETYFSWSLIPITGEDGKVIGLFNPAFEKTRRKIAERRMLTLREVGETTATAREVKSFWPQVLKGLLINEYDVPFVLLYSVGDDNDSDCASIHSSSMTTNKMCFLEGTLPEIPENHPIAPSAIDFRQGTDGFAAAFRDAAYTDKSILLETATGTLNAQLLEGFDCRGFEEKPRAAIVCPIHPTTGDNVIGFLVMGINPRRPYDDDYSLFIQLLSRQLATSMASVVLFEEEIKRGQRAAKLAALDRIELSEQLAARTQEAVDSEIKFTRMAELAPVGMFIADALGNMTFTNETFHKISGYTTDFSDDVWIDTVVAEDRPVAEQMWQKLIDNIEPTSAEFRFKTPWEDPNGAKSDTWVLASAYPERHEAGGLKAVFGSITNISQQKWAQDFQKKRMEEAVELKRQQSNFIDMTSHEMRNPLSAILQCADEITNSLYEFRTHPGSYNIPTALLDSNIDAAQTITLCANHQTRIVSDVLTLSKLDSALLLVTPVDVRPASIVQQALKMFEGELQTADIKMQFTIDPSLNALDIEWVKLDPSRLLQVLINLTTNAIKFTSSQAKRTITIDLSASQEPPSKSAASPVSYIPSRSKRGDVTLGKDWGDGEDVYLNFAVSDTGKGLTEAERKLLFLRFSQASPKTHVQYGGSGLGLFISRELVELQGGEIGVSSESGKGSTFAFYVKAKKSNGPDDGVEEMQPLTTVNSRKPSVNRSSRQNSANDTNTATKKSSTPKVAAPKPLEYMKVLIVEDNLVNQKVLSKALRNQGCTVQVANHGGECLDHLQKTRFWKGNEVDGEELSIILMDLEMPVMDGLTCTRTIRELQNKGDIIRHIPIIAVSANARMAHVESALAAGMDDVVSKPFRIPELVPKMEHLAAKYKAPT